MEDLRDSVERRRVERSSLLGADRAQLGQYFTPKTAADLIASMAVLPNDGELRLLDPGAGVGSLTAAIAARCASEAPELKLVTTAVEVDPRVIADLETTLSECGNLHPGRYEAVSGDFIAWAAEQMRRGASYDLIVMNPPYRKISKNSDEVRSLGAAGVKTTNLYTGFVTLALRLLAPNGQLIAITPRSFANGTYFKDFRRELLDTAALHRIHVFERRNEVFKDAEVLQENIIFAARRGVDQGSVIISASHGFTDEPQLHEVSFSSVVQPGDGQRFIHIATTSDGLDVASRMASQPATLADLGLSVSTGKVVDFRAKEHLRKTPAEGDVPLVYPGHLSNGRSRWPLGADRKPSGIARNSETEASLVPSGVYVIVKRFSAKEEPRRVVAAVVEPKHLPGEVWGFENHLNVYHLKGEGLDPQLAHGLAAYLNGDLVDSFVRLFNGHTQINAGDLRSLRYPSADELARAMSSKGQQE